MHLFYGFISWIDAGLDLITPEEWSTMNAVDVFVHRLTIVVWNLSV